jgi:hypothetical protein
LDFKRELPPGKGENKELARDLAQFAVDGGVLIIGVDDNAQLTPVDLHGLRERIDQVARDLVDEPLHVRIDTIPTAADPAKGYLLVTVPPSSTAPHQVDGRYYGRGDTTKHVLPDAEVQRLHQLALRRQRDADELLDAEVARDPTSPETSRQPHDQKPCAPPATPRPPTPASPGRCARAAGSSTVIVTVLGYLPATGPLSPGPCRRTAARPRGRGQGSRCVWSSWPRSSWL